MQQSPSLARGEPRHGRSDRFETEFDDEPDRQADDQARRDDDHLVGIPDGAGCAEIWEHRSHPAGSNATADD